MLPVPFYQDELVTIYHGDARKILPLMPRESVDMIFMDPPFGQNNAVADMYSNLHNIFSGKKRPQRPIANDGPKSARALIDDILHEAARLLKKDCCCCCCCCCGGGGPTPFFGWLSLRMDQCGLQFFHQIIWNKKNSGLGLRYRRQLEQIFVAHRKGGKLSWNPDAAAVPNLYTQSKDRNWKHPNQKPLALVEGFIFRHSMPGSIVLDPCMGGGTTLVAAKKLGRRAIGIELSKKFCAAAVKRIRDEVPAAGNSPDLMPTKHAKCTK